MSARRMPIRPRFRPRVTARGDRPPAPGSGYPWIDFDWPAPASHDETRPSLAAILAQLRGAGAAGIVTVLRLGAAGLFALAGGPWLAWLLLGPEIGRRSAW